MDRVTRAEEIAAALERWEKTTATVPADDDVFAAGQRLARLLRAEFEPQPARPWVCGIFGGDLKKPTESQPEPDPAAPAVGEDEALLNVLDAIETKLASTEQYELAIGCQSVATRLRAALSDLARLEARPSRYEDLMAIEQLQVQVDHYRTGMTEARAALAAAVAEGDQFCRTLVDLYDAADETGQPWRRISVSNALIDGLRARAGRDDG